MKVFFIIFFYCFLGCSSQKENPQKLCLDFIKLNQKSDFNILLETSSINSRVTGVYDETIRQNSFTFDAIGVYCNYSGIKGDFILLPLKEEIFEKRKNQYYKSDYFYRCKNDGKEDIDFYKKYVNSFYKEYNTIKTPPYHNNKNVLVEGNPRLGQFITFELNDKCNVYYLKDLNSLTPYWKTHFSQIKKVDDNWYYECK